MQYSKRSVVDALRHCGYPQLAEEAFRDLPDPVDFNELQEWEVRHGISHDILINRMGGSP
jgi:hypothetical protein